MHPCTDSNTVSYPLSKIFFSLTYTLFFLLTVCSILLGGGGCKAAPYISYLSLFTRSPFIRESSRSIDYFSLLFSTSVLDFRTHFRISEYTHRFCSFGSNVSCFSSPSVSRLCGFPHRMGGDVVIGDVGCKRVGGISNRGGSDFKWEQLLFSCPNRRWWVFEWLAIVERVPFGLEMVGVMKWAPVGFGMGTGWQKGMGGVWKGHGWVFWVAIATNQQCQCGR